MDNNIAITVDNLSKMYKVYEKPSDMFWELLTRKPRYREFWALKNIAFDLKRGEMVGIMGRNGAGKSTLLKILTGTLDKTTGEINSSGIVSSILELGTGFHPEYSGRENIYMGGLCLGMTREQIEQKVDWVIEFSELEEFIDQPFKTYSSGMQARLTFSTAVCIEPDILIVDEALSVGDAKFQAKCFAKLSQFRENNGTILLVSHDTGTVMKFCDRAILMDKGCIIEEGIPKDIAGHYFEMLFGSPSSNEEESSVTSESPPLANCGDNNWRVDEEKKMAHREDYILKVFPEQKKNQTTFGQGGADIEYVEIGGLGSPNIFSGGEDIVVKVKYSWDATILRIIQEENSLTSNICTGIALADSKGTYVFGCNTFDAKFFIPFEQQNSSTIVFRFKMPNLISGDYFLTIAVALGEQAHHCQLKWHDYAVNLYCRSSHENVYGVMYLDYTTDKIE
jgi:ABC-type polysaccharide/polyol phosphate transport system ATPase subunit